MRSADSLGRISRLTVGSVPKVGVIQILEEDGQMEEMGEAVPDSELAGVCRRGRSQSCGVKVLAAQ